MDGESRIERAVTAEADIHARGSGMSDLQRGAIFLEVLRTGYSEESFRRDLCENSSVIIAQLATRVVAIRPRLSSGIFCRIVVHVTIEAQS